MYVCTQAYSASLHYTAPPSPTSPHSIVPVRPRALFHSLAVIQPSIRKSSNTQCSVCLIHLTSVFSTSRFDWLVTLKFQFPPHFWKTEKLCTQKVWFSNSSSKTGQAFFDPWPKNGPFRSNLQNSFSFFKISLFLKFQKRKNISQAEK